MAIDKNLTPDLLSLQLDLEQWVKAHKKSERTRLAKWINDNATKPRNPLQGHTWRRGHGIERDKKRYTRKCKHKQELD